MFVKLSFGKRANGFDFLILLAHIIDELGNQICTDTSPACFWIYKCMCNNNVVIFGLKLKFTNCVVVFALNIVTWILFLFPF